MTVIDEIAAERRRQVEVEGWTTEHDDQHDDAELAAVAGCYALNASGRSGLRHANDGSWVPRGWPFSWSSAWWKPTTPRRDLVKAAALIVAEIERLDRKATP